MSTQLSVQTLLDRHNQGVDKHVPLPYFTELAETNKIPHIVVVTCADPRCHPEEIFHLNSSEVIVIRNPGANALTALNNILALDTLVGVSDILLVKHTDCGATVFRDAAVRKVLKERAPHRAAEVDEMAFGEITGSLEDAVKGQLQFLRTSDLVKEELRSKCRGFVFDVKTGKLNEVEA